MATSDGRTAEEVRREIEAEREQLASAVEQLREELGEATDITSKLRAKLPAVAGGTLAVGFVLAGGVGATMRYFARRGRERHRREVASLGRWTIFDRD
jgi:hypothetical protein